MISCAFEGWTPLYCVALEYANRRVAFAFATYTCKQALGVLPSRDDHNSLSDDAVRDLIPLVRAVEGSLVILHAVLDQRQH